MGVKYNHMEQDLFLLMLKLQQYNERSRIIETYVEAVNDLWPNASITYHNTKQSGRQQTIQIATPKNHFGCISYDQNINTLSARDLELIQSSARLLAVFLENQKQDQQLTREKSNLKKAVDKQTQDLMVTNLRLEQQIQERLGIERNLLEIQQLLTNAFDNASIGMVLITIEGVFYQANKSFCKMTGFEEKELLGMNFRDITHPEDYASSNLLAKQLLEGLRKNGSLEKRYITKSGKTIHVHLMASLLTDQDNYPQYFFTQVQDITDSKLAKIALLESEHYLKEAQSIAGLGHWKIDQKTGAMSGSEELYRILELPPQTNDINEFIKHIHPDERQIRKKHIERGMTKETYWDTEIRLQFPDGRHKTIHSIGKPVIDNSGEIIEIIGIIQDISLKKREEEELQKAKEDLEGKVEERTRELKRAKEQAESANIAKSEFLANISHELRNPMHHILSYSKYGVEKSIFANREKLHHYFTQIRKSGKRLMVLLNDLLDLSKMEAGKVEYRFEYNNVWRIISDAVDEYKASAQKKMISLVIEDPGVDTKVHCDGYRIGQVFQNLISNALRFSPAAGTIQISFSESLLDVDEISTPALQIAIADQGVGIPPKELDLIFEKFTQSSATKTGAGGTGLGLSICQEILEAHHGRIWAENRPSGGAVFNVLIPHRDLPVSDTNP